MQLRTNANSNTKRILVPGPRECDHPTLALPPLPVGEVRLDLERIRYVRHNPRLLQAELRVAASWSRPRGTVNGYQVQLVDMASPNTSNNGEIFATKDIQVFRNY